MKHLIFAAVLLASVASGAAPAFALSVALDVPVQYSFDEDGTADSVSGFKLGVGLPLSTFGLGIGYENYEAKLKEDGIENATSFTFYDLFFELPFPIVHITIGGGWGKADVAIKGDVTVAGTPVSIDDSDEASASHYFASLGWAMFPLVDLHLGYHVVNVDDAKIDVGTATAKFDSSGEMWSLGVRVGF